MMNKTLHVGHKRGHLLTDEQIDVLVEMVDKTHMDDSWFGQIDEAVNACGDKIHVVWDIENKRWMSIRYAVKTLDSGISCPEDFLDDYKLDVYKNMLDDLGIVSTNSRILGMSTDVAAEVTRYAVTFVEYGDSTDGKARVLGLYRTHAEAMLEMHFAAKQYYDGLGFGTIDFRLSGVSVGSTTNECRCEYRVDKVKVKIYADEIGRDRSKRKGADYGKKTD